MIFRWVSFPRAPYKPLFLYYRPFAPLKWNECPCTNAPRVCQTVAFTTHTVYSWWGKICTAYAVNILLQMHPGITKNWVESGNLKTKVVWNQEFPEHLRQLAAGKTKGWKSMTICEISIHFQGIAISFLCVLGHRGQLWNLRVLTIENHSSAPGPFKTLATYIPNILALKCIYVNTPLLTHSCSCI